MPSLLSNAARVVRHVGVCAAAATALTGCAFFGSIPDPAVEPVAVVPAQPDPNAPRQEPLETRHFTLTSPDQQLVGETQVLFTRYENTFTAIGRQYNLGYEELRRANPLVDEWLPGEATPVYLPTQTILPDAPHEGLVINVPAMRLFYYTKEKPKADPATTVTRVTTHPIGIGVEGWGTPFGEAKIVQKVEKPVWYVPASVRKEHAERGDPLPSTVPPGPDNPLGEYAMTLTIPSYLIHGTNKPAGVGMRSSHGCVRLYPEDIEALFKRVPRGTVVHFVNQPVLAGWRDGALYLEVHPPLAEETHDLLAEAEQALAKALERAGGTAAAAIDHEIVRQVVTEQRGIPFPVLQTARAPQQYLAASRIVENTVPLPPAKQTPSTDPAAGAIAASGEQPRPR